MKKVSVVLVFALALSLLLGCQGDSEFKCIIKGSKGNSSSGVYEYIAAEDMVYVDVQIGFLQENGQMVYGSLDSQYISAPYINLTVLTKGEKMRMTIITLDTYTHLRIKYLPLKDMFKTLEGDDDYEYKVFEL